MDFNKIKINYGGKITCRKIFKKKYIIFLLITIICLIIFISYYSLENRKVTGISIEIKEIEQKQSQIDNEIFLKINKNAEEEKNLSKYQTQINTMENEILELKKKEETTKKMNSEIISEREKLERQSTTLSIQLKTEIELKEIYDQKISSLTILLESLKKEYEKLLEQKGDKKDVEDALSIKNSKIINSIEAFTIEKKIKGTIEKKCFDGVEEKFNPIVFHNKCNDSPLLVLVKTDNKERIGAFSKVSMTGLEIKKDPTTLLFNIEQGKFYGLASQEYLTIVCDPNELPQFGVDLQIKSNGQGINSFPFNYGDKNKNFSEELTKNHVFKIENLEIYKVDL